MSDDNPVLAAALAWAARGWRLFPCDPRAEKPHAKSPLVTADLGFDGRSIAGTGWPAKASADPSVIRNWWAKWPDAMIGAAPGWAGAFVVDLDPKGEPVEAVEARLVEAVGPLPETARTITQSGGRHLWFARPGGEWGNGTPGLKNIDIRCDAGYVILPPSQLRNGNRYAWEAAPFDPATAPPVPARLLEAILARKTHAVDGGAATGLAEASATRTRGEGAGARARRRYATAALDDIAAEAAGAPPGGRGTALFSGACAAGRLVAAGEISEREALAALLDAASASGLIGTDGAARVEREIKRGLSAGRADAGAVVERLATIGREAEARAGGATRRASVAEMPDDGRWAPLPGDEPSSDPVDPSAPYAGEAADDGGGESGDDTPSGVGRGESEIDLEVVRGCAALDHSDTDNAERLFRHFGADLVVLAQEEAETSPWLVWTGTHWDLAAGAARARLIGQQLGYRIAMEVPYLTMTEAEEAAIAAAEAAAPGVTDPDEVPSGPVRRLVKARARAEAAFGKRKAARRAFAVSSKNAERIEKALKCLNPRLRRVPAGFNGDPHVVATRSHTLRFREVVDPECPDPDVVRTRFVVTSEPAHLRNDFVTAVVPQPWNGLGAPRARWSAFLDRTLPDPAKRRTVQQFAGTGLLGVAPQFVMFHYGLGANGKSVFLETMTRILGAGLAVGLPRESIVGGSDRQSGSASPDIARLYGKRMVRILEVKGGAPLQEDLIKRLTGGESFPVRQLFKGYFEFDSFATPHMSGNGKPTIDGTDNGIWRRMLLVHWDQTIPEGEQRLLNEFVGEMIREEGPGILAWLVEGALDYLRHGMVIADSVRAATAEYRSEMDPTGDFLRSCVRVAPGQRVQAGVMYEAYSAWSEANARRAKSQAAFGRTVSERFSKREIGGRLYYDDCELFDVPPRQTRSPETAHDDRYS